MFTEMMTWQNQTFDHVNFLSCSVPPDKTIHWQHAWAKIFMPNALAMYPPVVLAGLEARNINRPDQEKDLARFTPCDYWPMTYNPLSSWFCYHDMYERRLDADLTLEQQAPEAMQRVIDESIWSELNSHIPLQKDERKDENGLYLSGTWETLMRFNIQWAPPDKCAYEYVRDENEVWNYNQSGFVIDVAGRSMNSIKKMEWVIRAFVQHMHMGTRTRC